MVVVNHVHQALVVGGEGCPNLRSGWRAVWKRVAMALQKSAAEGKWLKTSSGAPRKTHIVDERVLCPKHCFAAGIKHHEVGRPVGGARNNECSETEARNPFVREDVF